MRDLLVLAVVYGTLPLIPFRPFLGLCVFAWLAYMRPQDLAWSLGSERFSLMVMVATLAGIALHYLFPSLLGKESPLRSHRQTALMVGLGLWVAITAQTALNPLLTRRGAFDYVEFEKTLLMALLTTGLVSTLLRFRILVGVIAFSLGLLGLKCALFGILRGGTQLLAGPGGFMVDRNSFALALNMAIPLLVAIGFSEKNRLVSYAALALVPCTALAVVFTFSRGGFLTLALVAFILVLRSGRPVIAALMLVAGLSLFAYSSTEDFQADYFGRTNSIQNYEEDASATGRLAEWRTSMRIFRDYPLTGVGPNNLRVVHQKYSELSSYKVAHNSFLQILVDSGLPALTLLLALLSTALWRLERLRRSKRSDLVTSYARNIQISIVAYCGGAMLLNMAYLDLVYQLMALAACLELVSASEHARPVELRLMTTDDDPWWKRKTAA